MTGHSSEVAAGSRFEFGKNWASFLATLDDARIKNAEQSLIQMLEMPDLKGKTFVDVGCGSGLFSLAARRLGASVHSFDYDPASVGCTAELRRRYFPNDASWHVEEGSALDPAYLKSLGRFDIVYSWGVLHHTGNMWSALDNVNALVQPGGRLFIALYNDQGKISVRWTKVKRLYNQLPRSLHFLVVGPVLVQQSWRRVVKGTLRGRPFQWLRDYHTQRGMSYWHDIIDWVGGYPFEVARADEVFEFYKARNYTLTRLITDCGLGCNQFVFVKTT